MSQVLNSSTLAKLGAETVKFKKIVLNEELWNMRQAVFAAGRRPGYKPDPCFTVQFDGEPYDLYPGVPVVLPAVVADHVIKRSMIQPSTEEPGEDGESGLRFDRYGEVFPMVDVLDKNVMPGVASGGMPVNAPRQCPYCGNEVPDEEFKEHLASEHARDILSLKSRMNNGGAAKKKAAK